MRIKNLPSIESMDGSQDALVIEQTDGSEDKSRKVSPAQLKQYVLNDMDEVPTQDSEKPVMSGGVFSTMAVPKYDATNRREYYEGGSAFSGNIDSSPTAGSNNAVSSGGTKTYVDNAVNTAMDNCKMAVFTKTLTSVAIDRAWGSVYESIGQSIDISSLGLSSIPKAVFLGVTSTTGAIMYELSNVTSSKIDFYFVRGNSVTVASVKVNALVLY